MCERYPAGPDSVHRGRRAVAEYAASAGATGAKLDAIALATSEALTNAVIYAYQGGEGLIHVSAWSVRDELWLMIADDGCGLRASGESLGLGLGMALISQASDELSIVDRSCGGTELRMRFDLAAGGQARGSDASASRPASPSFSTTR
jgi:anti-sigma regulatory factor (Ser/Thr protein kinase)